MQNLQCDVIAAGSAGQIALLRLEFPSLTYRELPGYGIRYGRTRFLTLGRMLVQIPKILIRVKRERAWLASLAADEKPDLVISDNRYGLHIPGAYCVFITHQLIIRPPMGGTTGKRVSRFLQAIHYRAIGRFDRCWIPDHADDPGLAGELSHPEYLPPIPTRYIGILSRMGRETASCELRAASGGAEEAASCELRTASIEKAEIQKPIDLLVLLSGPEPQRSILEKKILRQAASCEASIVLVRGLVGEAASYKPQAASKNILCYDHLPAGELNRLMNTAKFILARAGYSTIMDLATLNKPAILVPTPGQTEQEYLGNWLAGKGMALCERQEKLDLPGSLATARSFFSDGKGRWEPANHSDGSLLRGELREVLEIVKKRIKH